MVTARQTLAIPDQVMATKDGKKVVVKTLVVYKIQGRGSRHRPVNWDVDTTINDLTQSAVVRVVATHTYEEIMKAIADESMTTTLTKRGPQGTTAVWRPHRPQQAGGLRRMQGLQADDESGGQGGDGALAVLSVAGRTEHC